MKAYRRNGLTTSSQVVSSWRLWCGKTNLGWYKTTFDWSEYVLKLTTNNSQNLLFLHSEHLHNAVHLLPSLLHPSSRCTLILLTSTPSLSSLFHRWPIAVTALVEIWMTHLRMYPFHLLPFFSSAFLIPRTSFAFFMPFSRHSTCFPWQIDISAYK